MKAYSLKFKLFPLLTVLQDYGDCFWLHNSNCFLDIRFKDLNSRTSHNSEVHKHIRRLKWSFQLDLGKRVGQ